MKRFLFLGLIALAGTAAHAEVGVSVNIGEPGFFGQINIGSEPPPAVIMERPVVIEHAPPGVAPIYLRVPAGYEKHWRDHCREYHACDRPVYFVREDWYQNRYHGHRDEHRGEYREERRDEHHDDHHDHDDHR
jgi:hypothetical protein